MLGMVFTELLEMIEERYSFDVADRVIVRSGVGGAYTSVGNYDDRELFAIVQALSDEIAVPVPELLRAYGQHLAGRFASLFPDYFDAHSDAIAFFRVLEAHVHTEVRKLYETAKPPLFVCCDLPDGGTELTYRSHRPLAMFALGLVESCLARYGDRLHVAEMEDLSGGAGTCVRFVLLPKDDG